MIARRRLIRRSKTNASPITEQPKSGHIDAPPSDMIFSTFVVGTGAFLGRARS